jgi:hypothetical protein
MKTLLSIMTLAAGVTVTLSGAEAAPQLRISDNHRYLVDQDGRPFFLLADTPWFLQKLPIEDIRRILDDRKAKGFNALFLEILDDSRLPSKDALGHVAFQPELDITRPVFDPTNGAWLTIPGGPLPNRGFHKVTTPDSNSDGDSDWVLVLESTR